MDGENDMVFGEELWGEYMIDLDYEFDAPQYVDLSKEEPIMQATSAEKWFDTTKSDHPSQYVDYEASFMKLLRELGILSEDDGANNTSENVSESKKMFRNQMMQYKKPRMRRREASQATLKD